MNTYFRILIAIAIPLSLSNCKKDDMPPMQDCYEYAVTLHKEGNLNDAIFYYQLTALESQYNLEDSFIICEQMVLSNSAGMGHI